jgi:threonine dehydrogenase-like Zn-dependent dehydrogenase
MKAAILEAPYTFRIADQPLPSLKPGWALVKTKAAGLCGSDLHFYKGDLPSDKTVRGHEIAGVISDPGDTGLTIGEAVVVDPLIGCDQCPNCRRGQYHICEDIKMIGRDYLGGFAEYVAAPAGKLYPFDAARLSFVQAALADGVAVGVHAVNAMELEPGQSAAIIGDGTIGLMILQVAVARGAAPIVVLGKHERNLDLARRMGATHAVNIKSEEPLAAVRRLVGKVDVVYEAAGGPEPMLESALRMLRKGGRVAVLGITGATNVRIPWLDVVVDERALIGLQGYSNYKGQDEMTETVRLMEAGHVTLPDDAVTTLPLAEIDRGFRMMLDRAASGVIKVVALPEG